MARWLSASRCYGAGDVPVSCKSTLTGGMLLIMACRLIGAISSLWVGCSMLFLVPVYGAPLCVGDCDGDGAVTVNELITGVGIVLGTMPLGECPALDPGGDAGVDVSRLVIAVNNTLGSCPAGVSDAAVGTVLATTRAVASL